ncbi:MAG TPA: hypothetical protein VIC57_19590 [Candidatus Dormibacteraeota bacterium]|jgi:hypothetical protein
MAAATRALTDLRFHPWPPDKRGGSHPDACPSCGEPTYQRALRLDGGAWRRRSAALLTCRDCGHAWVPDPIPEPELSTPEEVT